MMQQGVVLMLLGMGAVFLFLGVLVAVTTGMSRVATLFARSAAPAAPATSEPQAADDGELVAVISAAVHRYRQGK